MAQVVELEPLVPVGVGSYQRRGGGGTRGRDPRRRAGVGCPRAPSRGASWPDATAPRALIRPSGSLHSFEDGMRLMSTARSFRTTSRSIGLIQIPLFFGTDRARPSGQVRPQRRKPALVPVDSPGLRTLDRLRRHVKRSAHSSRCRANQFLAAASEWRPPLASQAEEASRCAKFSRHPQRLCSDVVASRATSSGVGVPRRATRS